jgi:hypothetical protein
MRSSLLAPLRPSLCDELIDELSRLDDGARVLFVEDPLGDGLSLFSASGDRLTEDDRKKLLAQIKAGDVPQAIEVEAVTYIQRKLSANRKFMRFETGILSKFAKSFKGQPFLRDHNSWELIARGGTIVDSRLEDGPEEGDKRIVMRLRLVEEWAIAGVLKGTIDRFSIGWSRTDLVKCSVHKASVQECQCWPGDKVGEVRVEWIYTGAEGTEVSAVNVPAVVGTGIRIISQLDGLDRNADRDILAGETKERISKMDPKLLAALGLPLTATQEQIIAAVEARNDQLTIANAAKSTAEQALAMQRATEATRLAEERKGVIDTAIAQLAAVGKLKPGGDVDAALRRTAARDFDVFTASVKEMLSTGYQVTPAGKPPVAGSPDPVIAQPPLLGLNGDQFLSASPGLGTWLNKAGITKEQFEKHGSHARAVVAARRAAV